MIRADASDIRLANLRQYLEIQLRAAPKDLWIAEAGGYNGLRRSGVPLVPEVMFDEFQQLTGSSAGFRRATKTAAPHVRTPAFVWEEIRRIGRVPFLWNAIMAHPHRPGEPLSNRKPTRAEIRFYAPVLTSLIDVFKFERITAIGRSAEYGLNVLGIKCRYVRHPSMGGVRAFREGMGNDIDE